MLPKAYLTSYSMMSGSRWVITPSCLSGSWRTFLYSFSVYSCHLFSISSASVRSYHFCPLFWVAYEQKQFISHSSEGFLLLDHGACRFSIWQLLLSVSQKALSCCNFIVMGGARDFSEIWALTPFLSASPSWPIHLPKVLPNTVPVKPIRSQQIPT